MTIGVAKNLTQGNGYGVSAAMSRDGTTCAYGVAINAGYVDVYTRSGNTLTAKGARISAPVTGIYYGTCSALSNDGTVLIVGAPNYTGATSLQGAVYVYDWNGSAWVMRGSAITYQGTVAASDKFGRTVGIGGVNNERIIIGANASNKGSVMRWNGSAWVTEATGLTSWSQWVGGVSLSGNGLVAAFGNDSAGAVYVYDWNGSNWVYRGSLTNANSRFGSGISLNYDGTVMWVGAQWVTTNFGWVARYTWSGSAWVQGDTYTGTTNQYIGTNMSTTNTGNFCVVTGGGTSSDYLGDRILWLGITKALSGTYKSSGAPLAGKISALLPDYSQVSTTTSNGTTGAWSLSSSFTDDKHIVIGQHTNYNAILAKNVIPL